MEKVEIWLSANMYAELGVVVIVGFQAYVMISYNKLVHLKGMDERKLVNTNAGEKVEMQQKSEVVSFINVSKDTQEKYCYLGQSL